MIFWYENGKKSAEATFKDGLPYNGKKWLPNGEVCPISSLTNGTGVMVKYEDSGEELKRIFLENGKIVKESVAIPEPDFQDTPIPAVFPE